MKRSISIPTDTLWQAGFLLLTPFTAAWLMQFTYGVLPWAMLFPALLANALCIALLYWPLCGLTGRIAPCCIGIHIASGAWGAANCFVQSFRGTPISPPWAPPPMWRGATALRPRGRCWRPSPWRRPWLCSSIRRNTRPACASPERGGPCGWCAWGRGWPASCSCSPPGGWSVSVLRPMCGTPPAPTVLAAAWRYSSATRSSSRWRSRRTSRRSGWNRSWPAWSRRSRRRFPWSGPILWPS